MLKQLVLVCILSLAVNACSLISAKMSAKLDGDGFHRRIKVKTEIRSMKRLVDCKLAYFFLIPKGLFVDVDALNSTMYNHCFVASPFNVEGLSDSVTVTDQKPIIFYSTTQLRKLFMFEDYFEFDVHFRYNPPKKSLELSPQVEILPARVFLHCSENRTLLEEPTCKKSQQKLRSSCHIPSRSDFILINVNQSEQPMRASVPSGDRDKAHFVIPLTIGFVFISMVLSLRSMFASEKPKTD